MADVVYLTRDGYKKFDEELTYLEDVRRSEVAERLRQALEDGGELIENAEYEDAKQEQAFVEGRIMELRELLTRAEIIEDGNYNNGDGTAYLNSVVTVQEKGYDKETFRIVGKAEADPRKGFISDESPLGKALMGAKVGEKVVINAPDGALTYNVISIE